MHFRQAPGLPFLALLGLLFILPVAGVGGQEPLIHIPRMDFSTAPAHAVVRVVDGDTVVLLVEGQQTSVRLIGVDTPETVHPEKAVEAYGKEASQFLDNLLKGESVYMEQGNGASQTDKYGRTLAYLYRVPDGLFVNLEIVRQGYGHAYTQYPFEDMEIFLRYEQHARESEKGLWGPIGTAVSTAAVPAPGTSVQEEPRDQQSSGDTTVYMTRTGSKYHRGGCRHLAKSKTAISLKDAKARGLTPCSACNPPR